MVRPRLEPQLPPRGHGLNLLKVILPSNVGVFMQHQPQLQLSLMPLRDLLELAALARRLANFIAHDPAAPELERYAEELEAEIVRRSRREE